MMQESQSPLWRLVVKQIKPIVPLAGDGKGSPLYWVHSVAGEVSLFLPLAQVMGTERRTYGIQAPTNKLSGDFGDSVYAMAEYYADALTKLQPDGTFLLGGWSSGAVIALEMAQILRKRGREIPLLIVLDGILYNTGAEIGLWNPLYYWKLLLNFPRWAADNKAKRLGFRRIANRIKVELKLALASHFPRRSGKAGSVLDTFIDLSHWPPKRAAFSRALYAALEKYEPKPYAGRVLVVAAKTQPLFHLLQVDAAWRKIAPATETIKVYGTHQDMLDEPRARALGARLLEYLAKAGLSGNGCHG
jgi:thioesterase domain-containing protein